MKRYIRSSETYKMFLDEDLLNFLSDINYTHKLGLQQDLDSLRCTEQEIERLNRYMYWYMVAAEDQNHKKMDDYAHRVKEIVINLPDYVYSSSKITSDVERSKNVLASESSKKPFVIHYGYDSGDAESGPIIHSGWDIFYAKDEKSAEEGWKAEYVEPSDGFVGCWAEPATQEDVDTWEKDLDNLPFD